MSRRGIRQAIVALLCISVLGANFANAVTVPGNTWTAQVCTTAPVVFYINGIWGNAPNIEQGTATRIRMRMDDAGISHRGEVISLFNQSEGKALDIFQKLLLQKSQETLASQLEYAENAQLAAAGLPNALSESDTTSLVSAMSAGIATLLQTFLSDPAAANTLERTTPIVMAPALNGYKVVIVAHSEGNMFAQQLYARTQMAVPNPYNTIRDIAQQVQVVNVATPEARPDTGKYITTSADIVINGLARILSALTGQLQPASPNANSGSATYSVPQNALGHAMVEVYLNPGLQTNNSQIGPSMEAGVMGIIKAASQDAVSFGSSSKPGAALNLTGFGGISGVTYLITAPDGSASSVNIPENSEGYTPVLQLTCDQLKEGTYHVNANFSPVLAQGTWNVGILGLILNDFIVLTGSISGPNLYQPNANIFEYAYSGATPVTEETVNALDITVSRDQAAGGFDLTYQAYLQSP